MIPHLRLFTVGRSWSLLLALIISVAPALPASAAELQRERYAAWPNGPSSDENYFPIAVWLQNPSNAARFKEAGINLYVGLWRGPTEKQLEQLERVGVAVICSQNSVALGRKKPSPIVGWLQHDEPDNAQSLPGGKGYGPPVPPTEVVARYEKMRVADATRPILLNLGQGVAWDNWIGRGVRRNHPEDYPEYVKGCDIASFDIYPAVHEDKEVAGKLEFVGRGVERLRTWAGPGRIVWNCIECTHIENPTIKPTPAQVRAEVWMSLIHGSQGIIYFVHQFKPTFKEAALLDDPEMLAAVTGINREIKKLAPALNSPSVAGDIVVTSSDASTPIAAMTKKYRDRLHVFAVNMGNRAVQGTFAIRDKSFGSQYVDLVSEQTVPSDEGKRTDEFAPYEVKFYRIDASKP